MKTPEQDIADTIFVLAQSLGCPVYNVLPGDSAAYPFVFIGNTTTTTGYTSKTNILGQINILVDVWGGAKQRKRVSDLAAQLQLLARNMRMTPFYNVGYVESGSSVSVIQDDSSGSALWRASMILNFRTL